MSDVGWIYTEDTRTEYPIYPGEAYYRPTLHTSAAAATAEAIATWHPSRVNGPNAGAVYVTQYGSRTGWAHRKVSPEWNGSDCDE